MNIVTDFMYEKLVNRHLIELFLNDHQIEEFEFYMRGLDQASRKIVYDIIEVYKRGLEPQTYEEIYASCQIADDKKKEYKIFWFHNVMLKADVDHWSKMSRWSLEEAIALAFTKNPEIVNWEKIEEHPESYFVKEYAKIAELVRRAKESNELYDPIKPEDFIAWTESYNIPFSNELKNMVMRRSEEDIDWKTKYEELEKQLLENNKLRGMNLDTANKSTSQIRRKLNNVLKTLYYLAENKLSHKPGNESLTANKILTIIESKISKDSVENYLKDGYQAYLQETYDIKQYLEEAFELTRDDK
jgi:hypothetical protein